ncbi:type 1 fimbrial protein [Escherichia coli]|nr:type 1 fimbrial protein [Escherichia coli]
MKYNNIIFLGLCLGLTTYSALSADSVIKISGRVLDYGCTEPPRKSWRLNSLRKR